MPCAAGKNRAGEHLHQRDSWRRVQARVDGMGAWLLLTPRRGWRPVLLGGSELAGGALGMLRLSTGRGQSSSSWVGIEWGSRAPWGRGHHGCGGGRAMVGPSGVLASVPFVQTSTSAEPGRSRPATRQPGAGPPRAASAASAQIRTCWGTMDGPVSVRPRPTCPGRRGVTHFGVTKGHPSSSVGAGDVCVHSATVSSVGREQEAISHYRAETEPQTQSRRETLCAGHCAGLCLVSALSPMGLAQC